MLRVCASERTLCHTIAVRVPACRGLSSPQGLCLRSAHIMLSVLCRGKIHEQRFQRASNEPLWLPSVVCQSYINHTKSPEKFCMLLHFPDRYQGRDMTSFMQTFQSSECTYLKPLASGIFKRRRIRVRNKQRQLCSH